MVILRLLEFLFCLPELLSVCITYFLFIFEVFFGFLQIHLQIGTVEIDVSQLFLKVLNDLFLILLEFIKFVLVVVQHTLHLIG